VRFQAHSEIDGRHSAGRNTETILKQENQTMKKTRMNWKACMWAVVLLASQIAWAGEVENTVKTAMNQLSSKAKECKAVVKDVLGIPFEQQVQKAMEELRKEPRSLKLQLKIIDIMMVQADRLSRSLHKTKKADLATLRDRVVRGLAALASANTEERDRYRTRAKESKDQQWRKRYEELAQVCDRLARAYSTRTEQYQAVPITKQLIQIQASLEYLESIKQVLASLRDGIQTILTDEEALHELQRLSITVDGIQQSLKQFSEVVLAGALAGEDQPKPAKDKPKARKGS